MGFWHQTHQRDSELAFRIRGARRSVGCLIASVSLTKVRGEAVGLGDEAAALSHLEAGPVNWTSTRRQRASTPLGSGGVVWDAPGAVWLARHTICSFATRPSWRPGRVPDTPAGKLGRWG